MSLPGKRILIVEDELLIAEALRLRLEQLGYVVVGVTARGEEAVEMAAAVAPDLALMDIRLAGDMDGIAAGERIQARFGLPVVYLTANGDRQTLARVLTSKPYGYVPKPVHDAALQSAIGIALQKSEQERVYRQREQYYSAILDKLEEAVVVADATQRIVCLNAAAKELLGGEPDGQRPRQLTDLLTLTDADGAAIDPVARCLAAQQEVSFGQVWCHKSDGTTFLVNLEVVPFVSDGALPTGTARPVTEIVLVLQPVRSPSGQGALLGHIRVCAYCRNIMERSAEGKTVTVRFEAYFSRHGGYQFTHGICPPCLKKVRAGDY